MCLFACFNPSSKCFCANCHLILCSMLRSGESLVGSQEQDSALLKYCIGYWAVICHKINRHTCVTAFLWCLFQMLKARFIWVAGSSILWMLGREKKLNWIIVRQGSALSDSALTKFRSRRWAGNVFLLAAPHSFTAAGPSSWECGQILYQGQILPAWQSRGLTATDFEGDPGLA